MSANETRKISVIGAGYVGLSIAVLLSQKHDVKIIDIDKNKLELIDKGISPLADDYIKNYLSRKKLKLKTSVDIKDSKNSDFIILAVPTDFKHEHNKFDTSILEDLISKITKINKHALIIVKSTIPIGWTNYIKEKLSSDQVIFSPEFLREGSALYDNLYPSRIIIGSRMPAAKEFGKILKSSSLKEDVQVLYTNSSEAEAIKLFSNAYLAMRVAFFNEVDNFAINHNIDALQIISGICHDPRIGNYYNNPSFGYGGYCLPKDTKQLLSNFEDTRQNLIQAIVDSNETRLNFIAEDIIKMNHQRIGIYKLEMKKDSDNHRDSAITNLIGVITKKNPNTSFIIFDPNLNEDNFLGIPVTKNLEYFKQNCDLILCNRRPRNNDLDDKNIYSRDLYGNN